MKRIKLKGQKNSKKKTVKIYVCSSLRPAVVKRVDKMLPKLAARYTAPVLFLRPTGVDITQLMEHVRADIAAIKECDELWMIGEFGRDCSVEVGFALGIGKKIKIFKDKTNAEKIEQDWMWRIGYDMGLMTTVQL